MTLLGGVRALAGRAAGGDAVAIVSRQRAGGARLWRPTSGGVRLPRGTVAGAPAAPTLPPAAAAGPAPRARTPALFAAPLSTRSDASAQRQSADDAGSAGGARDAQQTGAGGAAESADAGASDGQAHGRQQAAEDAPPGGAAEPEQAAAAEAADAAAGNDAESAQVAALREKTVRLLADMENVRAIAKRDVESARKYGVSSFARELLDVADNLSRAMQSVPEEQRRDHDANPLLASLCEGVTATESSMQQAMRKHGIVRYGAEGERFNPEMHQAMFEAPPPSTPPPTAADPADGSGSDAQAPAQWQDGTVMHVMKPGYMIHDRVLRPAEVGVVKNPPPPSSSS